MTGICPHCNKPVRPGARFCGNCGRALVAPTMPPTPPQPPQSQLGGICPRCGKPIRVGARFCPYCRALLVIADIAPVRDTPPAGTNRGYLLRHALVAGTLFACLLLSLSGVGVYDAKNPRPTATPLLVNSPVPGTVLPISTTPEVIVGLDQTGHFGLQTTNGKLLTYAPDGKTNNTRIQVDGVDASYGDPANGSFDVAPQKRGTGMYAVWSYRGIEAREEVMLTVGATTRRTDTIRVQYTLTNYTAQSHNVAIRVMLDTLIGDNDGVPFLFAGENAITTVTKQVFGAAVPDYIEALERGDLSNPGTIVNLAMRGVDATPPDRLLVSGWYDHEPAWDYLSQVRGIGAPLLRNGLPGQAPDSAVGLFYNAKPLAPNESHTLVFYYGLGGLAAVGNLGLTVPLEVVESEKFSIIVIVMDARGGQKVQLTLPDSIALGEGERSTKDVTASGANQFSQVSWRLRAKTPADAATISVKLDPDGQTASQTIKIVPCGVTRPCNSAP